MELRKEYSKSLYFEGIIFILLGVLALVLPWAFTLGLEFLLGTLFVIGGAVQGYRAFTSRENSDFWSPLLGAALLLIAGLILLFYPLSGVLTLTFLILAYFLIDGIAKIIFAIQQRGTELWGWILLSGILEVILAGLVWSGWPISASWFLGTLIGISFLFQGITLVSIGSSLQKEV